MNYSLSLYGLEHPDRAISSTHAGIVYMFSRYITFSTMAAVKVRSHCDDIQKSPQDKRSYRGLELTNGMKMMLISDPETDKSSAAMDVHIGQ